MCQPKDAEINSMVEFLTVDVVLAILKIAELVAPGHYPHLKGIAQIAAVLAFLLNRLEVLLKALVTAHDGSWGDHPHKSYNHGLGGRWQASHICLHCI